MICQLVLRYTRYGRHVYAVGGNPEAARLSGLSVDRIILSVYVLVGFFAGLAGFVLSARLNSSEAVAGIGYELTVIASVVIGGTSLFGGAGSIAGTVIGATLIGVLHKRARAEQRLVLHPKRRHWPDHHQRGGVRPLRKDTPPGLILEGAARRPSVMVLAVSIRLRVQPIQAH